MSEADASRPDQNFVDFDAAIERCRPRLVGLLRARRGGVDAIDLDDAIQETLARAIRMRDRFDRSQGEDALFRWLSSILLNVAREHARVRKGQRLSNQPELAGSSITRSRAAQREERFDRLQLAIDGLPADYREVMMLVRIEGLAVKDVAERLGKTPNAISRMLLRATKKLRESFGDTASLRLPARRLEPREEPRDD